MSSMKIKTKMNKIILFCILLIVVSILRTLGETIETAEGSIKYIGKSSQYSPPFVLLTSSQRLYLTNEIYNSLCLIDNLYNKYFYFKLENNKIVEFSENIPKSYKYNFPNIMKINKFEFSNYDTLYIIWYFNFSPFVELKITSKNIQIFFTSPNSINLIIPKNYQKSTIELIATYINREIKQEKKYIIKIK